MNKRPEKPAELYSSFPNEKNVYETDGNAYAVSRYFTGDKDINELVFQIASECASREILL